MKSRFDKIFFLTMYFIFSINIFSQNTNSVQKTTKESDYINIILGRPTDKSITISILPLKNLSFYCEYGKLVGSYSNKTETKSILKGVPLEIEISNLSPNTKYYYRVVFSENSTSGFIIGDEHSFYTQRLSGSTFCFTIESDPHPYDKKGSHTLWDIAFNNQKNDNPDFLIDLGDTFGDDHNPFTITSNEIKQLYLDNRSHFGVACNSSPLFFCQGNHEGESGYYLLQTPPDNLGVYATLSRKYYYPNPAPNDFYSGNTNVEQFGIGLPQNYYSWVWGDALFVVLDAYRFYTVSAKPKEWEWTLGEKQYTWLKQVLENSNSKFKFVFVHQLLGEARGGSNLAKLFEWGGYNQKSVWEFDKMRTGWAMPIHQLMVKNGVNIVFHGHDHLFAKEELDGIVYQEVPMPCDSTYIIGTRDNGDAYTDIKIDASGHLRVTVSSNNAIVDYVRAWLPKDETALHKNGEISYTYSLLPKMTSVESEKFVPLDSKLEQNYPNPFNPSTEICYFVGANLNNYYASKIDNSVQLKVYDMLGREVSTLVDEIQQPGRYKVNFKTSNLSSGIYYCRLFVNNNIYSKKMIYQK